MKVWFAYYDTDDGKVYADSSTIRKFIGRNMVMLENRGVFDIRTVYPSLELLELKERQLGKYCGVKPFRRA